jgi:hypothetical protein
MLKGVVVRNATHPITSDVMFSVPGHGNHKPLLPERGESFFAIRMHLC